MILKSLRTSLLLLLSLTAITGLAYPLLVTGAARLLFPHAANGSLLARNGRIVGSELIGQEFTEPRYFWGRPSATTPFPYSGGSSSGSNLGPLNPALLAAVGDRVRTLKNADSGPIPVDLVTASGSGLDPHVSVMAALYQVPRVARARGFSGNRIRSLVNRYTEPRQFGILGEPRVNVLRLNLALDDLNSTTAEK